MHPEWFPDAGFVSGNLAAGYHGDDHKCHPKEFQIREDRRNIQEQKDRKIRVLMLDFVRFARFSIALPVNGFQQIQQLQKPQ